MFDIKNIVVGAVLTINKYTIFNINFYAEVDDEDRKLGLFSLPILGLLLGILPLLLSFFKWIYEPVFISWFLLIYYFAITGCHNLIQSYRTAKFVLDKSKDKEIFSTIFLTSLILLYYTLFNVSSFTSVLLMFIIGYSNVLVMNLFIKRDKSSTYIFKYCNNLHSGFAFVFSFVVTFVFSYKYTVALAATYCISTFCIMLLETKTKKLPASFEGFLIEASQLTFLILCYLIDVIR